LVFRKYFEFYRIISDIKVAPPASQENGQVECVKPGRTPILGTISEYRNQADRYELLNRVEFAINISMQCSPGEAPITLLIGCEKRDPVIYQFTEYLIEKFSQEKTPCQLRDEANENNRQSLSRNDDFVYIRNVDVTAGHCKKFAFKYRGPY